MTSLTHPPHHLAIAQRGPNPILTLRDIRDVEAYVRRTLHESGLPVGEDQVDDLIRDGVRSVLRVERALPRERALAPVLSSALPQRLAEHWQGLRVEAGECHPRMSGVTAAA